MFGCVLTLLLAFVPIKAIFASAVVTKVEGDDRITINWETQKLRFYGLGDEGDFLVSEKLALREGLVYLNERVPQIQRALWGTQEKGLGALRGATSAVYTLGTTYYANGGVKIDLETRLSRVLVAPVEEELPFSLDDQECQRVIILLSKPTIPQAFFELVTPSGKVYDSGSVDPVFLSKTLMGRWVTEVSGDKKAELSLNATVEKVGHFMVSEAEWERTLDHCEMALKAGSVVLVVPR